VAYVTDEHFSGNWRETSIFMEGAIGIRSFVCQAGGQPGYMIIVTCCLSFQTDALSFLFRTNQLNARVSLLHFGKVRGMDMPLLAFAVSDSDPFRLIG
jgi:hypothetical protein